MDCTIRNFTDAGGRLELSAAVSLPDSFEVYLPNKDEYFQAEVKWRKGNGIGVSWSHEQISRTSLDSDRMDDAIADRVTRLERVVAILQKRLDALQC